MYAIVTKAMLAKQSKRAWTYLFKRFNMDDVIKSAS
jgi:hypothetical protein